MSNTKLIARQDGDDISLPNRLKIQLEYLNKYNLDACTSRAFIKNSKKKVSTDIFAQFVKEMNDKTQVNGDEGRGIAKASVVGRMQDLLNGEKKKTYDPIPE